MKLITSSFFLMILAAFTSNATEPDAKKFPSNRHSGFIENKGQIIDQDNHPNPNVKYLFCSSG
ncbi:MAG: hypothetical protein ACHQK8_07575, partial [Bacteroidia bacterium]